MSGEVRDIRSVAWPTQDTYTVNPARSGVQGGMSRSLEYAKQGDYDQAIAVFMPEVLISDQARHVGPNFLGLIMLRDARGNYAKFEQALRAFRIGEPSSPSSE